MPQKFIDIFTAADVKNYRIIKYGDSILLYHIVQFQPCLRFTTIRQVFVL